MAYSARFLPVCAYGLSWSSWRKCKRSRMWSKSLNRMLLPHYCRRLSTHKLNVNSTPRCQRATTFIAVFRCHNEGDMLPLNPLMPPTTRSTTALSVAPCVASRIVLVVFVNRLQCSSGNSRNNSPPLTLLSLRLNVQLSHCLTVCFGCSGHDIWIYKSIKPQSKGKRGCGECVSAWGWIRRKWEYVLFKLNWFKTRTPEGTVKHLKRNKGIQSVCRFVSGKTGYALKTCGRKWNTNIWLSRVRQITINWINTVKNSSMGIK